MTNTQVFFLGLSCVEVAYFAYIMVKLAKDNPDEDRRHR